MPDRVVSVSLVARINSYLSDMDKVKQKNREVGGSADDAAARFERQNAAMQEVGGALLAAGAAATLATGLAVRAAINWESAWAGVTKTVDGTPEQLAAVEEGLRGLTKELPATHEEIAAVAEAAGQLGVQTENVVAFTRTMIDLGQTTNLSANEAATSLARFMNVMGTSQDQVSNLGAAVVDLGNNYATTEAEIVAMAQRLSGAGKQIGLSEGEVLGLATALSSVGIEAEAGGSAISKVMIDIAASVEEGGDRLELFARTAGVSADVFAAKWRTDPGAALALFVQGLADAESQGSSTLQVLSDLGITEVRMRDALLRSAAASDQFTAAMERGNVAFEENTALQTEAEKRYATTESQLQILSNRINDAAINFGSVFLPAVNDAAGAIGDFADFLGGLPPELQGVIASGTALVGVVLLLGGTALITIPKIAQLTLALSTLGVTAGGAKTALLDVGKAAAVLAAIALAHELRRWADGFTGARASAAELKKELTGPGGLKDALDLFDTGETRLPGVDMSRDNIRALTGDFRDLSSFAADFQNSWAGTVAEIASFGLVDSSLGRAKDNAVELDLALSQLVAEGNAEEAAAAVTGLAERAGISVEELMRVLPQYESASGAAEKASQDNAEALEEISSAAEFAQESIDDLAARLRNFGDTQLSVNDANRQVEQSLDDFQAKLEANGATLDINTQEGRDNAAALDDIARAYLESAAATVENTQNQADAIPIIQAGKDAVIAAGEAAGLSRDEAEKYADSLGLIPENVQTQIDVNAQAAMDRAKDMARLIEEIPNSKTVYLYIQEQRSVLGPGQQGLTFAGGGTVVHANASGNMWEGIYPGGRPLYKFAEYETGWETFVSGRKGMERENLGYAVESIRRLGHQNPQAARDVLGGGPSMVRQGDTITIHEASDPVATAQAVQRRQHFMEV